MSYLGNVPPAQKREDRFSCDICGARFTFSANLSRHMKRTHKMICKVVDTSPIIIPDENEAPGDDITKGEMSPVIPADIVGTESTPLENNGSGTKSEPAVHQPEPVILEALPPLPEVPITCTPMSSVPNSATSCMSTPLVSQPQSLFRPISFGTQPSSILSCGSIPTIKTSMHLLFTLTASLISNFYILMNISIYAYVNCFY